MKKFLAIAAIVAVTFTACNDSKTGETTTSDTNTIVTPVVPDTTKVVTTTTTDTDTMHVEGKDTTNHKK